MSYDAWATQDHPDAGWEEEETCPNCARDFEGCECSAAEGGIGHDSFRDEEEYDPEDWKCTKCGVNTYESEGYCNCNPPPRTCSICDGYHTGFCPLEDSGRYEPEENYR